MCSDLAANLAFLDQAAAFSQRMSSSHWQTPSAAFRNSSLGQHLRHTLEHVEALLDGLPDGCIDYDARKRDEVIERQPELAADRCRQLKQALANTALTFSTEDEVLVRASCSKGEQAAGQKSTLGRELQFLVSHTVHHFAIMAGICHGLGIQTSDDFGVAPSTLKHRERVASQ